jgi:hypothetical protein
LVLVAITSPSSLKSLPDAKHGFAEIAVSFTGILNIYQRVASS